jgi:dolichol-phosphate mannosyltransferase
MSRLHNFGNRALSKISSIRNSRRISDLCTGLWGFNSEALMAMEIKSKGFDLEAELAGLARRKGLAHVEVQVDWTQRKGGTSKLRSLTDGFIILLRIIRT